MKSLFDQTNLAGMMLKNRFIRSATYDGVADADGRLTAKLLQVYRDLAEGGVGAIITGLVSINGVEAKYPGQMGIYDDSFIDEYQELTAVVHSYNAKIIMQIASLSSQAVPTKHHSVMWGPSAVTDLVFKTTPQQMALDDIKAVQQDFADAAWRAKLAGFDGVQLHAAHGYLLSKFLTPYYNRRSDHYGGVIENRARMMIETYQAVRERVGADYPILVKINCDDFMDQGASFADCQYVCRQLARLGITAIEVSGGIPSSRPGLGTIRTISAAQESYFRTYAVELAEELKIPVILVGGHRDFDMMSALLNASDIAYFSLCRPLIRESDLINRWYQQGDLSKSKCISCNKCFRLGGTSCVFNA